MPRFRVYGAEMRVTFIKLLFAGGLVMSPVSGHTTDAISFAASDRVQVFADYYSAGSKAKPLILLFHQAGSNRGEYATIGRDLRRLDSMRWRSINDLAVTLGGGPMRPLNILVRAPTMMKHFLI
jgi:hypothetical protein